MPRQGQKPAVSNTKNTKNVKDTNNSKKMNKPMTHGEYLKLQKSISDLKKQTKSENEKSMKLQKQEHHPPKRITHFSEAYTQMMLPRLKKTAKLIGDVDTVTPENPSGMSAKAEEFFSKAVELLNNTALRHVHVSFRPNLVWMLTNCANMDRRIRVLEKLQTSENYSDHHEGIKEQIAFLNSTKNNIQDTLVTLVNTENYTKETDDSYNSLVEGYVIRMMESYNFTNSMSKARKAEKRASKGGESGIENGGPPSTDVTQASKLDFKSIY